MTDSSKSAVSPRLRELAAHGGAAALIAAVWHLGYDLTVTIIGWADFRGNLQFISTGNIAGDDRVALIVMDYPRRQRLKIYGRARVAYAEEEPELVARLEIPDYDAVVQRAVIVTVAAYDWNCQPRSSE